MKKITKIFSLLCVVGLALMLAACGKKTEAPQTQAPTTTATQPATQAPTTTTKPATQAPVTTTKAPQTTTVAPTTAAPTTAAPATTVPGQPVSYTVTLEEALPEGRTVLVWAWNASSSVGYVPEINGTTLTFTADSAIDGAIIVVLKEGQTSLGVEWVNKDYQSPNLVFTNNAATWNNHAIEEDIDYTITLSYEITGRTLLVYAWSDSVAGQVLTPTVNGTVLSFSAKAEFTKALVVVLKEGQTELGDEWVNKDYQSDDLTFTDHAASYANAQPDVPQEDVTYTVTLANAIEGRTLLVCAWSDTLAGQVYTPTVNGTTLTFTAKAEYTGVIVVVLKEGQTELGDEWVNKDYQSEDLTITDHAATYNNPAPEAPAEDITYTVTLANEVTGRTILIHAWNSDGGSPMITPTVNGTTLTFTAKVEYTGLIVVVLKEGETEVGDGWVNKDFQSEDLTITNHACSYNNPALITYTINTAVAIGRTVYVLLWDGEQSTPQYTTKATVNGKVITCVGYREYTLCLLCVLQEGETEVNSAWSNLDYETDEIYFTNHEGTYDNSTVQEITYTITLNGTLPENRTIVVWAWGTDYNGELAATVEGNTLTFKTASELNGCLIVVLKEGETVFGADWDNKMDKQTNDLTITNHTATWDGSWK